jgi:hypothetical protein
MADINEKNLLYVSVGAGKLWYDRANIGSSRGHLHG